MSEFLHGIAGGLIGSGIAIVVIAYIQNSINRKQISINRHIMDCIRCNKEVTDNLIKTVKLLQQR